MKSMKKVDLIFQITKLNAETEELEKAKNMQEENEKEERRRLENLKRAHDTQNKKSNKKLKN